jgi:tetratricopeptide (TPR) repeat protein
VRARLPLYLALGLALLTVAVWQGSLRNGFVNYDDPEYVTENPWVQAGLTGAGVRWALTAVVSANWHPLTLLSHMLDCQLYGLDPRGHHLTNLLLHLASTLLLFQILRRTTGRPLPSAMVAALFAVHPTHVESVAWVAERKDVLCGCCWMLTLAAYTRYVARPAAGRYLLVAVALALALLAKPMAVSLPAVLLLLDVWPLGRLRLHRLGQLALEKVPLAALAVVAAVVALRTQQGPLAVNARIPLSLRLANAVTSAVAYLGKTFLPVRLGVGYPLPHAIPGYRVALAALVLLAVSWLAWKLARRAPYVAVGWLWYLVTLAPVIGIVQVGTQAMADRYLYLPAIGIYLAVVWSLADLAALAELAAPAEGRRRAAVGAAGAAAGAVVIAVLSWRTVAQVAVWKDSITLFRHSLTVAESYLAHVDLADALAVAGDRAGAYEQYRAALAVQPANPRGQAALGIALRSWGRAAEAVPYLERSLRIDPGAEAPRVALAMARDDLGQTAGAVAELQAVLARHPGSVQARFGLAALYDKSGDTGAALAQYRLALALAPRQWELYPPAASLLLRTGDLAGAAAVFRRWLALDPGAAAAHAGLGYVLARQGRSEEARRELAAAGAPRQR